MTDSDAGTTGGLQPTADPVERLRLDARGLLPAVVQDATTRQVLMLAWMDAEALRRSLRTRQATYWSRSRQQYWVKGETSGHTQHVREARLDCDGDTVLLIVDQTGPACHTGAVSCFDHDALLEEAGAGGGAAARDAVPLAVAQQALDDVVEAREEGRTAQQVAGSGHDG